MAFLIPLAASAFSAVGSAIGVGGAAAGGSFGLGTALSLGSTLLGAVGAISQGQAQAKAAKYNAAVQEQQANIELDQGAAKASDAALKTRQRVAAARAGSIQNGFETDGSVSDILDTVQTQGTLESLTAIYDSTNRARGLRNSAELNRSNARNSITASYLGAGTSLLSGFSKAYNPG